MAPIHEPEVRAAMQSRSHELSKPLRVIRLSECTARGADIEDEGESRPSGVAAGDLVGGDGHAGLLRESDARQQTQSQDEHQNAHVRPPAYSLLDTPRAQAYYRDISSRYIEKEQPP